MEEQDVQIEHLIDGCRQNHRASQQRLFAQFYNYAMTIARRYTGNIETANEAIALAFIRTMVAIH